MKTLYLVLLCCGLSVLNGCGASQDFIKEENKKLNDTLVGSLTGIDTKINTKFAEAKSDTQALRNDFQALAGRVAAVEGGVKTLGEENRQLFGVEETDASGQLIPLHLAARNARQRFAQEVGREAMGQMGTRGLADEVEARAEEFNRIKAALDSVYAPSTPPASQSPPLTLEDVERLLNQADVRTKTELMELKNRLLREEDAWRDHAEKLGEYAQGAYTWRGTGGYLYPGAVQPHCYAGQQFPHVNQPGRLTQ